MTIDVEVINGHPYQVTRDDQGNIVSEACIDPPASLVVFPGAVQPLLTALKAGTATAVQQQQALAAILLLLVKRSDLL